MVLQEPLLLRPNPKPKVWGGATLRDCVEMNADDLGPVGEVWTLADREESSSEIVSGTFAGRSLRGLMLSERTALLGTSKISPEQTFPIIVKLIDADRDLSVQVHPDARYVGRLGGGAEAKDEFWYILGARPGARIYLGLKDGVDATTFAEVADSSAVVDLLQEYPVRRGDSVFVPAGTVHSIGSGITLAEVQQNSDSTFRIYDWGRTGLDGQPRACHLDQALQTIDYETPVRGPYRPEMSTDSINPVSRLVDSPHFGVERLAVHAPMEHDTAGRAWAYLVLSGHGQLLVDEVSGEWSLNRGETWLMPASLGPYRFHSPDGNLQVLRIEAKA